MILVPLLPMHIDDMTIQPGQSEMAEAMNTDGYSEFVASLPNSYSLINDGVCLGCGGIIDQGDGRGLAWTLISEKMSGHDMVAATRYVKKYIQESNFRRVEAIVKDGFYQGHRWIKMLGFSCETPNGMLNWFKDGTMAYLYARSAK